MRHKLKWLSAFLIIATLLIGCSDNDDAQDADTANPPQETEDADTEKDSNNNTSKSEEKDTSVVEAPYSFIDFEVEVDIDGVSDAFEADYEAERTKVDASYEDKAEDIKLKDEEAMEKLEPILDGFTFDESSSEDEILNEILDGFSIDNYDKIEIDITFKDGTEIDFER